MRSDYKISRARDGRLIVKQAGPGGQARWPLAIGVAAALGVLAVLGSFISPNIIESLRITKSETLSPGEDVAASHTRTRTITAKLPLPVNGQIEPLSLQRSEAQEIEVAETNLPADALNTTSQMNELVLVVASGDVERTGNAEDRLASEGLEIVEAQLLLAAATPAEQSLEVSTSKSIEDEVPRTKVVEVKSGDSLYMIFNRLGLSQAQMLSVTRGDGKQLRKIHPGQSLEFEVSDSGVLEKLVYRVNQVSSIHFTKTDDGFISEDVQEPFEARASAAQGDIQSSLFLAAQSAGLSDRTIMSLVEIFGWDVDFALDIRQGDQFSVIYEELYKNGEKVRDGAILAAEFVNQGRRLRALRYTDENNRSTYFSPDGSSMRKAFLRTPVNFARISSHFNLKRKHPILNTIRAHKGVDYAASRGTPVRATGDGKIDFLGRKGGYGKTIVIRHGSTYTTLYGHLNGYAKGMAPGKSVRQGQLIGYVGSTGLATGPHLHYEFRVRGMHRNPLKVELPHAAPISPQYKEDFLTSTRGLLAQLEYMSKTQLASGQLASQ